MKPTNLLLLIAVFAWNIVCAQPTEPSAKASALGGSFATQFSVFSARHNVAGLAFIEQNSLAVGVRNNFQITGLNDFYLLGNFKLQRATLAFDFSYYGFSAYQQGDFGISYAQQLTSNWSAGARLSYAYNYLSSEDINRYLVSADLGIVGKINNWRIGTSLSRFAQSKWQGNTQESAPIIFRIGGGYFFSSASITAEVYKSSQAKADFRLGLSYQPASALDLRIGFSTINPSVNFGVGLIINSLEINFAASWHTQLGLSPITDVVYAW